MTVMVQTADGMAADTLFRLSRWYARHCNGEREHHHGVSIQTTDNPGWWVKVDLAETDLADRAFAAVSEGIDVQGFPAEPRWLHCQVKDGQWQGAGDETRLAEILGRFLAWAEA